MIAVIVSLLCGGAECSTPAATNHIASGLTIAVVEESGWLWRARHSVIVLASERRQELAEEIEDLSGDLTIFAIVSRWLAAAVGDGSVPRRAQCSA